MQLVAFCRRTLSAWCGVEAGVVHAGRASGHKCTKSNSSGCVSGFKLLTAVIGVVVTCGWRNLL